MLKTLTWILPAHNEAATLPRIMARLDEECRTRERAIPQARVLIIENGSTDSTWETAKSLERLSRPGFEVAALQSTDKGIGYAYAMGIRRASEFDSSEGHLILGSASDLPFGMSDIDAIVPVLPTLPARFLIIGSKRHPKSRIERTFKRQVMTLFFFLIRRIILGSNVRDSQGTFCLPAALASSILEKTKSRDFFFSTEFIYWAEKQKIAVSEVPVTLEPEVRNTTVHAFRDGMRMLSQILRLRVQNW